jgi:hypothetical protein
VWSPHVPAFRLPPAWGSVLVLLTAAAVATFWPLIQIRPFDVDNLTALSWAARARPLDFLRGQPLAYPEWRPLAYLTIWAQYQIVGLEHLGSYFLLNVSLWTGCAFCLYLFVARVTRSHLSGLLVALVLLFDSRAIEALKWITGRQSTLAGLFGFSVLLLATVRPPAEWKRPAWILAFGSLLAAALSKEYGLAFGGAFLVLACLQDRPERKAAALVVAGVAIAYLGLRLLLVSGAAGSYCTEMGFFTTHGEVCYRDLDLSRRLQQHLYNAGATVVGTAFPAIFTVVGTFRGVERGIGLAPAIWLGLAIVGWITAPRRTLPMLALILVVAGLSVMLYRGRNQLLALLGLYAAAGVGLAYLLALAPRRPATRLLAALGLAIGFWSAGQQAIRIRTESYAEARRVARGDPCFQLAANRTRFDAGVMRRLKTIYDLPNPDCGPPPSGN